MVRGAIGVCLLIRFDLKLFILGYNIKLERKWSKSSSGLMEGLRALHPMVRGSIPDCVLLLRFDWKLFILGYNIKLERKWSKSSSGLMEGLRALNPMVRGSIPVCSFNTFWFKVVHSRV